MLKGAFWHYFLIFSKFNTCVSFNKGGFFESEQMYVRDSIGENSTFHLASRILAQSPNRVLPRIAREG